MFAVAGSEALRLNTQWWHWALLGGWFLFLILFDLLVIHKRDHTPTLKSSVHQSLVWIFLGLGLGIIMLLGFGREAGGQYFTGFLIEQSLSIDNVFAWSVILSYFAIPGKYRHRVLFWGIFGALVMRAVFVFAGIALINRYESILLIFGLILIYSAFKLLTKNDQDEFDPGTNKLFKWIRKIIPVSHQLDGHKLFTKENGKRVATVLFVALIVIEITDAIFAVDSVPAILAVSRDPFIILSSNAAAILGLRALYFVFEFIKDRFWLLNKGLGLLLLFIGGKMLLTPEHVFGHKWVGLQMPTVFSLGIIALFISATIAGSLLYPKKET